MSDAEQLFDGQVDPELVDVIRDLNELGFLGTLYSCAGYGRTGRKKRLHLREDHPYLVVGYRSSDIRSPIFHFELCKLAAYVQWFPDQGSYGYYFRPDRVPSRLKRAAAHAQNKESWDRVRALVREWRRKL